jgi:hypothetical protein
MSRVSKGSRTWWFLVWLCVSLAGSNLWCIATSIRDDRMQLVFINGSGFFFCCLALYYLWTGDPPGDGDGNNERTR